MECFELSRGNRGRFLAATAAIAAVLLPDRSPAQAPVPLRVMAVPNDDVSPLLYAQQSGLFRRAGLDVSVERASTGNAIAAALVSGSYDIGLVSLMALITGHARGIPFVMIAPSLMYLTDDPAAVLVVLKDSAVRSVRDLPGKVLSVAAIKGVDWVALHGFAEQAGVDAETFKYVELPMSAISAALEQRRIEAGTLTNPSLEEAMATGKFRAIGKPFDGIAKRWMIASYCTTADTLAKNRDAIDRFATAMRTATLYANAHHTETAPLIAAFTGIETAQVLAMKRTTCGEYLDAREIQPAIDASAKYKAIDRSFPAQELISPSALKPPR
jgi:NitT/TauT family transport system substrate-binding protein